MDECIDSSSSDVDDEEENRPCPQPHPFRSSSVTTHTSNISRVIPISMAALYTESDDPPEYMSIESPPSSPEDSHAHFNRTKTTEWLKNVSLESNQFDQSCHSESMKTPVDSAKKSRNKKFIAGGLADKLQKLIQRENSEITFWEHQSTRQEEEGLGEESGKLDVSL